MYLPVPPQRSCPLAWLAATDAVDAQGGHEAHNVVIDIADPVVNTTRADPVVAQVDDFLKVREKSVFTVANTIFPLGIYQLHGAPALFDVFQRKVLPKVRKNQRWSGYYFERMIDHPARSGERMNLLWDIGLGLDVGPGFGFGLGGFRRLLGVGLRFGLGFGFGFGFDFGLSLGFNSIKNFISE
jgi:hypothetical protein